MCCSVEHYARMEPSSGIEPLLLHYECSVLPLSLWRQWSTVRESNPSISLCRRAHDAISATGALLDQLGRPLDIHAGKSNQPINGDD